MAHELISLYVYTKYRKEMSFSHNFRLDYMCYLLLKGPFFIFYILDAHFCTLYSTFLIQCFYLVGLVILDVLAIALHPPRLTQSGGRRSRARMEEEEEARSWGIRRSEEAGSGGGEEGGGR